MKLWKATVQDGGEGACLVWASSKAGAKRLAKELIENNDAEGDFEPPYLAHIEQMDVPTDRKGLVAWLNLYFNRDNG
jgi:hypothetical protein